MAIKPIRILLVDDHSVIRMGLSAIFGLENDLKVVGEADDSASALELFRELRPDVTLMDVRMPGGSGVEAVRKIRAGFPTARILMLTTYSFDEDISQAMEAGASGYLLKSACGRELAEGIRRVHAGQRCLAPVLEQRMEEHRLQRRLSVRELEVLDLMRRGLSNLDIGVALGVSGHTAKSHVKSILEKMEVADRTEAVACGIERGLLKLEVG